MRRGRGFSRWVGAVSGGGGRGGGLWAVDSGSPNEGVVVERVS